jgi:hypothetical protein
MIYYIYKITSVLCDFQHKYSRFYVLFYLFVFLFLIAGFRVTGQIVKFQKQKFEEPVNFSFPTDKIEIVCMLTDPAASDEFKEQNEDYIRFIKNLEWSNSIDSIFSIKIFIIEPKKEVPGQCPTPDLFYGPEKLKKANHLTNGFLILIDKGNFKLFPGGFDNYIARRNLLSANFFDYYFVYKDVSPVYDIDKIQSFFTLIQKRDMPLDPIVKVKEHVLISKESQPIYSRLNTIYANYILPPSSFSLQSSSNLNSSQDGFTNGLNLVYSRKFSQNSRLNLNVGFSLFQASRSYILENRMIDSIGKYTDKDGDSYTSVAYYTPGSEKISLTAIDFSPSISYNIGSQSFQKGKWNLSAGLGFGFSIFTRRQYNQFMDTFALGTYYPQYLTSDTIFNGLGGTYQIKESYNSSALTAMKGFNTSLSVPLRFSYFITDGFGVNLGYSLSIGLLNLANPGRTYEPGKVSHNSIFSFSDKIQVNSHIVSLGFIFKI